MIEYGIRTSSATYWIHFFPWGPDVYWYLRDTMVKFLSNTTLKPKLGFSKENGEATGNGYCVPKNTFFIMRVGLTYDVLPKIDWGTLTTEEAGALGEMVIDTMLVRGILGLPQLLVSSECSREGQYEGRDGKGKWYAGFTYEVKTERVDSPNLYVQIAERRLNGEQHGYQSQGD